MALFSRLFGGKKNEKEEKKCSECKWPQLEGSVKWKIPDFERSQIRLVVFKDNVSCGRTLLFDSKAITKLEEEEVKKPCCGSRLKPANNKSAPSPPSGQPRYQFSRPGSDTKMLGEMMFGCVAMSYQGSSIKVHSIRCPPQLMFTKILIPSAACFARSRTSSCDDFDSYSLQSSFGDVTSDSQIYCKERASSQPDIARSVPVEIPSPVAEKEREDSGLSTSLASSGSFTPIFPSSPGNGQSSINSCNYKSFQRRWHRSQQTSLEFGVRNRLSDPEALSGSHSLPTPTCKKAYKLGVGILVNLYGEANKTKNQEFVDLFFSHITLLERHVEKLSQSVERAVVNKKQFHHVVMESLECFISSLVDLFVTPRLTQPVWLNMMSAQTNRQIVCLQFMTEFTNLVNKYEVKESNFFVSTVLTAVLTHHLAWVPTVTPSGVLPSSAYLDKHSAKWLDTLARSHPYNPLWAQLSDLYGAIGYPMKMARTVIVGKNRPLMCTLLYILSYFIRCSEVYERTHLHEPFFPDIDESLGKEMSPIKESGNINEEIRDSGIGLDSERDKSNDAGLGRSSRSTMIGSPNPSVISSTPKNEHIEASQCKLSEVDLVLPKTENVLPVQKSNTQVTGNSRFYVRLPSNDEAIVTEMDDYFDGKTEVRTYGQGGCGCGEGACIMCGGEAVEARDTRSDDAGFVSMESGVSDVKADSIDVRLSPIHSPRTTSESDVFTDVLDDVTKRRHTSGERSALSRQLSQSSAPGRCLSLTPTELGRRRHVSSGSVDSESADPFLRLREIPLPRDYDQPMTEFARNFGHSLMAGLSDHYLSDFVLHGTCDPKFYQKLEEDLAFSAKVSVLDEAMSEVSCVVADVSEYRVYALASTQHEKLANPTIQASQLVANLVEGVSNLWNLRMPPEFCLMHLEDRLQEIYFKSRMLAEYLRQQKQSNIKDLTDVLGFDCSDLTLLLAVASTHSPELAFGIS